MGLPIVSTAAVVFALSDSLRGLPGIQAHYLSTASPYLWTELYNLINASEIIWKNGHRGGVAVLKCSADVLMKMVPNFEDFTEYTTMQYLAEHAPEVPFPKPLGLITLEKMAYIFMSFIPGPTLETAWPQLLSEQKVSIRRQLNFIFLKLRGLDLPTDGV